MGPRGQVILAALLFSTGSAAIKALSLSGPAIGGLRSMIAVVAILALEPAARRMPRGADVLAGCAYAATLLTYVMANRYTTGASAIFLQMTAPVWLLLLSPWLLREKVRREDVPILVLVGAGTAILFAGTPGGQSTAPDPLRGNVLAAISGVTWAITLVALRRLGKSGGAAPSVVVGNAIAALAVLPFLGGFPAVSWGDFLLLLYLGVIQIGLAYVLTTRAIAKLGALEVSILLFFEPALNPVWTWIFHGERVGAWGLVGGALVLVASLRHAWVGRKRERASRTTLVRPTMQG